MALKTSNHIRHVLLAALVTLLGLSCGVVIASSLTHSSIRDLAEWTVNDPVLDIGDTIKYLRGLPQSLAVYPITLGIIAGSVAIMTASFGIVVAVFMWPSGRTTYHGVVYTALLSLLLMTLLLCFVATLAAFIAHYTSPVFDYNFAWNGDPNSYGPGGAYVSDGAFETNAWICQLAKYDWSGHGGFQETLNADCSRTTPARWLLLVQSLACVGVLWTAFRAKAEAAKAGTKVEQALKEESHLYLGRMSGDYT